DPIGETLEVTISGSFTCRAIAYNSEDDTFFVSNWGDPVWEVSRDAGVVDQFDLVKTVSTYGFAYDKWSDGGPFLWVYDQTSGSPDMIYQWDLAAGGFTDVEHNVQDDISNSGIAGGLCLAEAFEPGQATLGGCSQGVPDIMFMYDIDALTVLPEHDLGIKKIICPESGYATADIPIQVMVKNYGNHTETTDVQLDIIKCEGSENFLLDENFSEVTNLTFPPEGWTTDWWNVSNTSEAGAEAPEAICNKSVQWAAGDLYDNYLCSPPIDCTGWEKVNLRFALSADIERPNYNYLYLKYRKNSTSSWKDVTPWENPISQDFTDWFEIGCYGFGGDLGNEFQINFTFIGYAYYFYYWYLDDVTLETCG
ncbi:unnamed protein product, partial [marine sediment metagenome]